jgi:ribosomal protein S15P/S13E
MRHTSVSDRACLSPRALWQLLATQQHHRKHNKQHSPDVASTRRLQGSPVQVREMSLSAQVGSKEADVACMHTSDFCPQL